MNYGFIIDNRKCIGCHACTVACKAEHNVPLGVNRTWVKYIEKGEYPHTRRLFTVTRCNHCADAPCVEICPVTALYTRPDGIVDFNNDRCIGCKACTQACPYDALYIDPNLHTAAKCNYCTHRIETGIEPACVIVCPVHAIISGDIDNPASEIARLLASEPVQVRKPEKNTRPKLFYIGADQAGLTPALAPGDSDYMWSSQSAAVGHGLKEAHEAGAFITTLLKQPETLVAASEPSHGPADYPAIETEIEKAKRVYDVPSEGVMWGWQVAAYIWTKAIAAGAVLVPFFAAGLGFGNETSAAALTAVIIAMVFLGLTGVLLAIDLDRPERFFYVLIRPQWRSWLTRGAYIITGYAVLIGLWAIADILDAFSLRDLLHWPILLFAALTAIYTGFLFSQAKGRDFWQNPAFVLQLLAHAFIAGSAVLMLISLIATSIGFDRPLLIRMFLGSLSISALILAIELSTSDATADAQQTKRIVTRGAFARLFWIGVAGAGLALPLLLASSGSATLSAVASGLALVGLFFYAHIWVRAPQLVALS